MANPRRAFAPQLELPSHELTRLIDRIETDYQGALADHEARMRRFVRYYSRWRDLEDPRSIEDSKRSKYRVPLMQWQVCRLPPSSSRSPNATRRRAAMPAA